METIQQYIKTNEKRFLDELIDLLKIPSISADSKFAGDVKRAAEFIKEKLIAAGADKVEVCPTPGHPIIYGEKMIDPKLPTVIVYGHYDVQPVDPLNLWDSPPFEPVIKDGKIYARGACDDKGQVYMHVKAFELMMKTNSLACNVRFMIEGEEEVGSNNLGTWVKENKHRLKGDVILISDTSIIANDIPSIEAGLRGLSYVEVEVTGPNRDLHSGVFGGAVANPIQVLCKMIDSMKDENNHITIPGFYDDVIELSKEERTELNKTPFSLDAYKKDLGVDDVMGEAGYTTLERTGIRPTLELNGIWGGYTGEGSKTVLPSKAFAKISMRLVPHQQPGKIAQLFARHFESIAPDYVRVKVTEHHGGYPYVAPTNTAAYRAASKAYETTYGKKPIPTRSGGSIPIISTFEQVLGIKSILMGFGLDTDAAHSPNENYHLECFYKGIETITWFYKYYADELNFNS